MSLLKLSYRCLLLTCFALIAQFSEAKIIVKSVDCLGNLTVFDYNPGAGLTVSTIKWDFGDGYTSVNIKSNHIYKSKGFFTVKVDVILTGGGTQTDSKIIEIVGLPGSSFEYQYYSDSCFNNNLICFKDKSIPAATGQNITKRILVWGDGGSDVSNIPKFNDVLCHKYLSTGPYKATMEVTDKYGCKGITSYNYNIVGSVETYIGKSLKYADCNNIALCFSNLSKVTQQAKVKYYWRIDSTGIDTNSYWLNQRCIHYKSSKTVKATLTATTTSGCSDSVTYYTQVDIKPLPNKLLLTDSVVCYGDSRTIFVLGPAYTADLIQWEIDSVSHLKSINSGFSFNPKAKGIEPGKHLLTCRITRGNCIVLLKINFIVKGPVAALEIYNQYQCSTNRQVSMVDRSSYVDTNNVEYFWRVKDADGGRCTTNYIKDYNLYSNCNYAIGSYHKHTFNQLSNINPITLIVRDKATGCVDSVVSNVELLRCSKLFNQSSYTICQGEVFLASYGGGPTDPILFTLDSGVLWRPFPSAINAPLKGYYNVGFIFRKTLVPWTENTGNDSFRVRSDTLITYDTIYKYKFLNVLENKYDSLYFKDYKNCGSNRVSVFFKNKLFYAGEKIEIDWGDLTTYKVTFTKTTLVDSIHHLYTSAGVKGFLYVKLFSASKCFTIYPHVINFGKNVQVKFNSPLCLGNPICMKASVSDNLSGNSWLNFNKKQLVCIIDDSLQFVNQFSFCHKFRQAGLHKYKIITIDSLTCTDTTTGSFYLQDIKAVIANTPKILFCSELRQFFDSSYVLNKLDPVTKYKWDFGTNTSVLQNPFISFNSSADSVTVFHIAETSSGCIDTTRISIRLVGGKPYFTIKDTVACGSMNAIFYNKSKNCKSYIWEFGDDLNSTIDMNDTQFVRFNYLKPGRYHIKLKGIDTIYNPSTGNTYYCITEFPGKDSTRAINILPLVKSFIYSKDTICLGDSLLISTSVNPEVEADQWAMGDGNLKYLNPPDSFTYFYRNAGVFKITYRPVVKSAFADKVCIDSAEKNVAVLGVKADFIKDPASRAPYLTFNNLSQPAGAILNWDFGQPSTGSLNYSTEENPTMMVVTKFKQISVCLKASIPFGCRDTICKPFIDDDSASVVLFNVFTPGNNDEKNDHYDVLIAGEDIYDLRIYNRWGVLVFKDEQDRDIMDDANWNGKVNNTGVDCPSGNYFYIFRYRIPLLSNETKTANGVIQLIR